MFLALGMGSTFAQGPIRGNIQAPTNNNLPPGKVIDAWNGNVTNPSGPFGYKAACFDTLLFEDFQSKAIPASWINIDNDGLADQNGRPLDWFTQFNDLETTAGDTNWVAASSSWFSPAGTADNWLILDQLSPCASTVLEWRAAPFEGPGYMDGYTILVSTTGTNFSDFTDTLFRAAEDVTIGSGVPGPGYVHTNFSGSRGLMTAFQESLAAYDNQNIYIAFHHKSTDDNMIWIDDIFVGIGCSLTDQTVSSVDTNICQGSSTSINIASSESGIDYFLRDISDNSIVDGPIAGSGSALNFNTGALTDTTTFDIFGRTLISSDFAVDLPANNDYIDIPGAFNAYTNQLTVEAWVYSSDGSHPWAGQALAGQDALTTNVWVWFDGIFIVNDGGLFRYLSLPALPTGWTHMATTIDTNGMAVFYNGVQVGSSTDAIVNGIQHSPNSSIHLGHDPSFAPGSLGRNSNVAFDNFRIWDIAQTEAAIDSLKNECLTGSETGLRHLMNMPGGSGTVVSSLAGNDGALVNGSAWITGIGGCELYCEASLSTQATINIMPTYNESQTFSLCHGQTVTVGTNTYNTTGMYTDVLTSSLGCDSTIVTNLTILPELLSTENVSLCFGQTYTVGTNVYDSTGTYTDVFMGSTGCDSTVTTNLTVEAVIDTAVTTSGITLTADATSATYQWIDCNTMQPISGETGQSYTATANGNYAVVVTQNGCSDTSACAPVMGVGITEATGLSFGLFPNPNNGLFTIETPQGNELLEIFGANGQLVYNQRLTQKTTYVSSALLSRGVYVIKIQGENGIGIKRLLVH